MKTGTDHIAISLRELKSDSFNGVIGEIQRAE